MEEKINSILNDLYDLDPKFEKHESELRGIVLNLLESAPDTKFDRQFANSLRKRILHTAKPTFGEEVAVIKHNFMKKLSWSISVVAVCVMVVMSSVYINNKNGNSLSLFNGVKITSAGEGAFGELNNTTAQPAGGMGGGNATLDSVANSAGTANPPMMGSSQESMNPDQKRSIAPFVPQDLVNYKYLYQGEGLNLSETKLDVLKRVKGLNLNSDVNALLGNISQGLVNFSSFGGMKMQSAYFVSESSDGYSVSVDAQNGSIHISGNWPQPLMADTSICAVGNPCGGPVYKPVLISEVPDDQTLISIANEFISAHGIPTAIYGQPEVMNEWRVMYDKAADKSTVYVPETVVVVYPLLVNDQIVYDESGNKNGLMVGIHVRNRKVVHAGELNTQVYQSSSYDAETDVKRILSIVEQGGMYGYAYPEANRTVEVQLGEPKLEYVKMWNYTNNQSEELLVPSLIFPVLDAPNDPNFYRRSVVVPLIKQILDRSDLPVNILRSEPAAEVK